MELNFVCYTETKKHQKTYKYINILKTWFDATSYCRKYYTSLAMIESATENSEASSLYSKSAWIGLYRRPWTWTDQTRVLFKNWMNGNPDNSGGNYRCVAETDEHLWDDLACDNKLPFLCRGVSKLKTTVRMMIQTDADISDSSTNDQILQQFDSALKSHGFSAFTLKWTIQPRKQPAGHFSS
ncbi:C-type Lectin CRL-like [Sphaeramia orbicularis]|uniref:C-type Lectin CRL-like n=1 Tax=Sphaeramia orbicularis TaxID=375764 RepID=UPI00117BF01A|nr:C-type Lectin CRL-like [Sphaeramia orbicularis]